MLNIRPQQRSTEISTAPKRGKVDFDGNVVRVTAVHVEPLGSKRVESRTDERREGRVKGCVEEECGEHVGAEGERDLEVWG